MTSFEQFVLATYAVVITGICIRIGFQYWEEVADKTLCQIAVELRDAKLVRAKQDITDANTLLDRRDATIRELESRLPKHGEHGRFIRAVPRYEVTDD